MKEKMYQICKEILGSEEETKKFLSYETLEELYEYFLNKLPGLTKDEFEEFICEALDNYAKKGESVNKVVDNDLDVTSGGTGLRKKFTASVLGLMSMLTAVPGVGAANANTPETMTQTSKSANETKGIKTKISDKFKKIKAWVKEHPKLCIGLSIAAVALLFTGGVYAYNKRLKGRDNNTHNNTSSEIGQSNSSSTNVTVGSIHQSLTTDEIQLMTHAKSSSKQDFNKFLSDHKGINLNCQNSNGKTPIMLAAENRNYDVVDILLSQSGIKLNEQDKDGKTLLMYIIRNGESETNKTYLKKLLNDKNVAKIVTDSNGDSALTFAINSGHTELAKIILEYFKKISLSDATNKNCDNPLICAVKKGNKEMVKILLNAGAKVDHQNAKGETALICAVKANNKDIFESLLLKEINVDLQDELGNTALIYSAINGNVDFIQKLRNKKAAINLANKDGNTALICAAEAGKKDAVECLIKAVGFFGSKSNVAMANNRGETALSLAAKGGHLEIVKILWGCSKDVHDKVDIALVNAASGGNENVVEYLLEETKGQEAKKRINLAQNALSRAADDKKVKVSLQKYLLRAKLDSLVSEWNKKVLVNLSGFNWSGDKLYELAEKVLNDRRLIVDGENLFFPGEQPTDDKKTIYNIYEKEAKNVGFLNNSCQLIDKYNDERKEFEKMLSEIKSNWIPSD